MPTQTAHPVQALREQSTNFEAALAVCRAEPRVRAVHKLRTESRRLEAQIVLLKAMHDLPAFRSEATKALWQIKKLRQAAGRVRDLDVQASHLEDYAGKVRAGSRDETEKQQALGDIEKMLAKRAERRAAGATELVAEIEARQDKVAAALEKLNSALRHAVRRPLPNAMLLGMVERQFARTHALKLRNPSADDLHTVRKAAKQARYLAENATAKSAVVAAKRFEHLQELGGDWHDWLDLTAAARKELGKKHAVAAEFAALRDGNLRRFREELDNFVPPSAAKARRSAKRSAPSKQAP